MTGGNAAEIGLAEIRMAPADRPFVVAQLGQSLDGRIATLTGDSRWINGSHALRHLHALRAVVDAVVVGVGTVVADDPQLTVRHVQGAHPARVVIDPLCRGPSSARCYDDDGTAVYCVTTDGSALPKGVTHIPWPLHNVPEGIVQSLFALGLHRILIEGGATTISRFIDSGMVDRLQMLVAPVLLGSGLAGLQLAPIEKMVEARRPAARVHVFPDGDVLFDCDLRRDRAAASF